MARARNIKPGFFKNEILAEMPVETRLLFVGLWCLADREGRLDDRPRRIRAELFPYDSFDVDSCLSQLAAGGFLIRYEVDGKKYAQVVNFTKHQMPHHKEVASEIPAPPGCDQITKHTYDVSNKERSNVFERDGLQCLRCGSKDSLSLDHIKPLGSGGDNSINNLQTLCKSCNSSKGNTTKDYRRLNVDSTLNQRRNNDKASCPSDSLIPDSLIPDSLIPDSLIPDTGIPSTPLPAPKEKTAQVKTFPVAVATAPEAPPPDETNLQAACKATFKAYQTAYSSRYGTAHADNAKVRSQIKQFVQRLGVAESPLVAAWFVGHPNSFYVQKMHGVGVMLVDAEKIRTEWATGSVMTNTKAHQTDRTQSNANAAREAIENLKAKGYA